MRKAQDWDQPCPNPDGSLYKLMPQGNGSALSTDMTHSGKRRILRCAQCQMCFSATRDTVFFDLRTSAEKVMMALKLLWVKVDLAGSRFVLGVTEETVLAWRARAAHKAQELNVHVLRELPVTPGQLDAMWHCMARTHSSESDTRGESPEASADGRQGIWVSCAPEDRLMLATCVGPRTIASAKSLMGATAAVVTGGPGFCSDGFSCSLLALLACYHTLITWARTGTRGRPKNPVMAPPPDLVYGQLIKQKMNGRLKTLSTRILVGTERLQERDLTISPALIERVNLTMRQALAPLVRKTYSVCKDREQRRRRVVFFQAFDNVARPHQSLRTPLPVCEHVLPGIIQPKWAHRTPGMAAGITDHVWTVRELLTVKFDRLDSQSIRG